MALATSCPDYTTLIVVVVVVHIISTSSSTGAMIMVHSLWVDVFGQCIIDLYGR